MNQVFLDWFELEDENVLPEAQREFLLTLSAHVPRWLKFGVSPLSGHLESFPDLLTVSLGVSDHERSVCVRTLRCNFNGTSVILGFGEPNTYVTNFDTVAWEFQAADVVTYGENSSTPQQLADFAARWLDRELSRVIQRHEWRQPAFWYQRYVLADTAQGLSWSGSRNQKRFDLGAPDRVVTVHPPSNRQSKCS